MLVGSRDEIFSRTKQSKQTTLRRSLERFHATGEKTEEMINRGEELCREKRRREWETEVNV